MRLMRRAALQLGLAACAFFLILSDARAERAAEIEALMEALLMDETIAIIRDEGLQYGDDLKEQMVPEANPASWTQTLERIYDTDKMSTRIAEIFEAELAGEDLAPIMAYYTSDAGAEIVLLEVTARRAFLDTDTEEAAKERYAELAGQGVRLLEQVNTLMADSDLVETNVAGALNSDLKFYLGLVDGGAFEMTESEMLREVWAQEGAMRESTREWLQAFLMLAYQPVDPDTLDAYVAFWRTPEGKLLNRAIFTAFDQMFEEISYLLGQAVAQEMTSEKL